MLPFFLPLLLFCRVFFLSGLGFRPVVHGKNVFFCCLAFDAVEMRVSKNAHTSFVRQFFSSSHTQAAADRQEHVPLLPVSRVAGPYRIYLLSTPFEIRDRGMPPGPGYVLAFPGSRLCIPASLLDTTFVVFRFLTWTPRMPMAMRQEHT